MRALSSADKKMLRAMLSTDRHLVADFAWRMFEIGSKLERS
jgi:hypothetical protein